MYYMIKPGKMMLHAFHISQLALGLQHQHFVAVLHRGALCGAIFA